MRVLRYWLLFIILLNPQNLFADTKDDLGSCGEPNAQFRTLSQVKQSLQASIAETLITEGIVVQTSFKKDHPQPYRGFWLADGKDGLFIFSDRFNVKVGDKLRLAGKSKLYKSLPEISHVKALIHCERKQHLPAPIPLSLPVKKEHLISLLGRRVKVESALVRDFPGTNGRDFPRYGQITLGSQVYHQGTEIYQYPQQKNDIDLLRKKEKLDRLLLDDGSPAVNPDFLNHPLGIGYFGDNKIKIGDRLENITGVVHRYKNDVFIIPDSYRWIAKKQASTKQYSESQLRLISLNLENFFNGEGASFKTSRGAANKAEFDRQLNKLVELLMMLNSDVISLNEIENDGNGKTSAVFQLTSALSAASGIDYAFVKTGTKLGGDAITNAQIYRKDRVSARGRPIILDFGHQHRPLLVQQYRFNDKPLWIASVHLRSKSGRCQEDGAEYQYFGACNSARIKASQKIVRFLADIPQASGQAMVLIGDFNSYRKEPALQIFRESGYLIPSTAKNPKFSGYRYRGQFGHLDHVILNKKAMEQIVDVFSWPVNSLHSRLAGYKFAGKGLIRSSDHDPLVLTLEFSAQGQ